MKRGYKLTAATALLYTSIISGGEGRNVREAMTPVDIVAIYYIHLRNSSEHDATQFTKTDPNYQAARDALKKKVSRGAPVSERVTKPKEEGKGRS